MKKFFILLLAVGLAACSNGGGSSNKPAVGGGGVVTEFGQKMAGVWTSACTLSQDGVYKETLTIKANGTGESTLNFYNDQNCADAIRTTQGPTAFSYTVETLPDGSARITISQQGGQAQVVVRVVGSVMEVQGEKGQLDYTRDQQQNQAPAPTEDDFDRAAKGLWISENCFTYNNNTTARQQLTINGRGSSSVVIQVYSNQNCSGRSRPERASQVNYRVDHFANGRGQITVNNQASDVVIERGQMTITDANGTIVYNRVN